jgi:pyruvate formate lyase activating enzyme
VRRKKESLLYERSGAGVVCLTCERRCTIAEGKTGFCKTRRNEGGRLYTLIYGDISSISANPMEKKPFFHFYPGTRALTVGSWSCNFTCPWCQNDDVSKRPEDIGTGTWMGPDEFVAMVERTGCRGTSLSFNEPTLLLEYTVDVFRAARARGQVNTFVTNGYMTTGALDLLIESGLDAMNVDVKGGQKTVHRYCGADVEKVWRNAAEARRRGVWVELTTLVIRGINDDVRQLEGIARRIRQDVGRGTPWHVTACYPACEFADGRTAPATDPRALERAVEIGKSAGLEYVYSGNVPGHLFENTYCPRCGEMLIERYIFSIVKNRISGSNHCPACGHEISIIQ